MAPRECVVLQGVGSNPAVAASDAQIGADRLISSARGTCRPAESSLLSAGRAGQPISEEHRVVLVCQLYLSMRGDKIARNEEPVWRRYSRGRGAGSAAIFVGFGLNFCNQHRMRGLLS